VNARPTSAQQPASPAVVAGDEPGMVAVWDLPLRIAHWALAFSVPVAWLTANVFDTLHEIAGYTALGAMAFRGVWGMVGPRYARFTNLLCRPTIVLRYLLRLTRGRTGRYLAHNPAGAAMAVALLVLTPVSCVSGWMQITERWFGVDWVEQLHTWSSHILFGLALVHVLGVLLMSRLQKENLVVAMVTGKKRSRTGHSRP
jgi:cytochrome b